MKENNGKIYKKWWFWVCMVLIAVVVGFVCIMAMGFQVVTTGINEVALNVQGIDNEATVYTSAGGNAVIVEIPNYTDDAKGSKVDEIKHMIANYSRNGGILSNYSEFVLIRKINSDSNDYFYNLDVYNLPSMTRNDDESKVYIDFVEFTNQALGNTNTSSNSTSETSNYDTTTKKGEDIELTAGKYVVGEDIKAGKYDVIAQSGRGNIYIKGSTSVIEMMGTTDDEFYLKQYNNVTLENGDTVEITSKLKVKLQAK